MMMFLRRFKAETSIFEEESSEDGELYYRRCLLAVHVLLWTSGLTIVVAGTYVNLDMADANILVGPIIYIVTNILLLVSGGLISVFGVSACFGQFFKKRFILCVFAYAVTLVFVLQCVIAAFSFTWKNEVHYIVEAQLLKFIREGHKSNLSASVEFGAMDRIQVRFLCCGAYNYTDWQDSDWLQGENETSEAVPLSCCKNRASSYDCNLHRLENIDTQGCIRPLTERYQQNYIIMGSSSIVVSILQYSLFYVSNYLMFNLNE